MAKKTYAQLDIGSEKVDSILFSNRAQDIGRLNNSLLPIEGFKEGVGKALSGLGHGEGSRASAVLGLDDFVSTELDALSELLNLLGSERETGLYGPHTMC